jgi:hypothetical protein
LAGALLFNEKLSQSAAEAVFQTLLGDPKPSSEHKKVWFPLFWRRFVGKEVSFRTQNLSSSPRNRGFGDVLYKAAQDLNSI